MAIQVVGAAINIVLDPVMIFWMDMGVAGAAWATVIAFMVSSLMGFYWYLKSKDMYIRFERKNFGFNLRLQKEILNVGLPESVELTVMNFFNIILNMFVIVCAGPAGLAVYTMAWRIGYLTVIPAQAMGGAMVAVCSAEYGMKEFDMIVDAYRFTIKRAFAYLVALNLIFAMSAWILADVFLRTEDMAFMHDDMVLFILLMAVFLPPFSMTFVGSALMQSLEKATHAMMNTLARNIAITIAYWVVSITVCSLTGIGVALVIVEGLGGVAMIIHGKLVLRKVMAEYDARAGTAS
jgi:Na+-driven multidrug efflux pump